MKLHRLLLPTIFIGGFLFHLFWEAKSQYTITYFVLLMPYCAKGLMDMTNEMIDQLLKVRVARGIKRKLEILKDMDTIKFILFIIVIVFIINLFV